MFGSRKRGSLAGGMPAQAAVADVDDASFEEQIAARVAAELAAQIEAQLATAVPADLATHGILGRGAIVDVQRTPSGELVDCLVTLGVRLVDGSEPYRATCHVELSSELADQLVPGATFATVRADPHDHTCVALSLAEETPVVTITDPRALEPPLRALREGTPCHVTLLTHHRQWLRTPAGDELYAITVRVDSDGAELHLNQPVPPAAVAGLQNGRGLPAKRLSSEPKVLAIDWAGAPRLVA